MSEPERYRLGILFVHGIGEQPEGETLLGFGEPIIRWLDAWLRHRPVPGAVTVRATALTPSKLRMDVPPHAEVRVTIPDEQRDERWLMAESWWGGDVHRPAFGKMAGWMMTVGAWSILSHLTKHIGPRQHEAIRFARYVFALAAWIVLASLLQVIVLVLSVFALVPIPGTRKVLTDILLTLTGVLGDSYVLIESDIQRSAIVDKTREALRWVGHQCQSVVVIAHSQGAAVAHLVLRNPLPVPDKVRTFVTFGSGLGKIEEILRIKDKPRIRRVARLVPLFLFLVAVGIKVTLEPSEDRSLPLIVVLTVIAGASIVAIVTVQTHWESAKDWLTRLSLTGVRPELRWTDIYASRDLVANGALSPDGPVAGTVSKRIKNVGSVIGDHTAYWQNQPQFVTAIAMMVADCGKLPIDPAAVAARDAAAAAHERNVWWLAATFWGSMAAIGLVPVFYRYQLARPGLEIGHALHALGGPFERIMQALHALIAWEWVRFGSYRVSEIEGQALGVASIVALILLARLAYLPIWRAWDNAMVDRAFGRDALDAPTRALIDVLAIGAGFIPLILVSGWPLLPGLGVGSVIRVIALCSFLALLAASVVNLISAARRARAGEPGARKERKQLAVGVAYLLFVVTIVSGHFVTPLSGIFNRVGDKAMLPAAYVLAIVAAQRSAVARIASLVAGRAVRILAWTAPALSTLLFLFAYRARFASDLRENASEAVIVPLAVYFAVVGLTWPAAWLVKRAKRAPSAPAAPV